MIYTESGKISEIQNILKFNKDMNKFTYGVAINGVIDRYKDPTPEDYDKFYRFSNPEKFKKQNGGICWDYVTYEADYFHKHFPNLKFNAYYVEFDDGDTIPTHTFLVLQNENGYILFESSFIRIRGVYLSNSEKDIFNFILHTMGSKGLLEKCPCYIFKYNPLDHGLYDLNCTQFMHYIEDNGTQIDHKFSKDFSITKL